MSDLIDKIARDIALEMAGKVRFKIYSGLMPGVVPPREGLANMILPELKKAMREAVRLSGGTVPTKEREEPKKKYDPWAPNNNPW